MDDEPSDQIAESTSNNHIGWKVLAGKDTGKRDSGCHGVDDGLGSPSRIFGRNDVREGPHVDRVLGGHGGAVGPALEPVRPEFSRFTALLWVLAVGRVLQGRIEDKRIDSGLRNQKTGFAEMVVVPDGSRDVTERGVARRGIDAEDVRGGVEVFFAAWIVSQLLHDAGVLSKRVSGSGSKGGQPEQIFSLDAQRAGDDVGFVLEDVKSANLEGAEAAVFLRGRDLDLNDHRTEKCKTQRKNTE